MIARFYPGLMSTMSIWCVMFHARRFPMLQAYQLLSASLYMLVCPQLTLMTMHEDNELPVSF